MTIEEKAKEYESNIGSQDYVPIEIEEAFKAGSEYILEKACEYIKNQYPTHYQDWAELADECVKQFKKAMEE